MGRPVARPEPAAPTGKRAGISAAGRLGGPDPRVPAAEAEGGPRGRGVLQVPDSYTSVRDVLG